MSKPKKEDASVNSLGVIPTGRLVKRKKSYESMAQRILQMVEDEDDLSQVVKDFEAEMAATEHDLPGNPPSWVSNEPTWAKAKQASKDALGKVSYPFVVYLYKKWTGE